ncbi:hypothetical protein M8J77_009687 [Diaphorina citri]|nr:hypothetical protein M8J77_009687 [Diaphorina citri]
MFKFLLAVTLLCVSLDFCSCAIEPDCSACASLGGVCAVLNGPGHSKCRNKQGCYFKIWICDKQDNCQWAPITVNGHRKFSPKCRNKQGCYFKIWICDKQDNCQWAPYNYQKVNCRTCQGRCDPKAQTCITKAGKTLHYFCKDINYNCGWQENVQSDPCTQG